MHEGRVRTGGARCVRAEGALDAACWWILVL